jgi:hypothetical protein
LTEKRRVFFCIRGLCGFGGFGNHLVFDLQSGDSFKRAVKAGKEKIG